ncbi:MAG: glycogen debranching protein GlgX [Candidatus Omnitrophica bacterium]|nr:glycogen debranching protein GlgX [Candidatus Omnitrophota bacterium]
MLEHKTRKRISEGSHYPFGATLRKDGVNFAVYSKYADEAFLLLFDAPDKPPTDVIRIGRKTRHVWHVFVHGLKKGQLYGFKVRGRYDPQNGLRFNENKLLLDPYAKALTGKALNRDGILYGYSPRASSKDLTFDDRDSAVAMPKSVVVDDDFDWQGDKPLNIPLERSIIYEVHLKGFTAHASSNVKRKGTYLGFIEKIPYLKELGITAVEFLPLQEFYTEDLLANKGLANYWGYNTIGFFAPESSYAYGSARASQVTEFKTLVRELHKAGIEVILDVVYNHTGEGDELGPTVCFRGIDNLSYYCLKGPGSEPRRYYANYSGCGNCLNVSEPQAIRFILDSLRYWVEIMHVDGFRFDLAAILGRAEGGFTEKSPFFDVVTQDPVLNRVKLIAEPWDIGTFQVGKFPVDWSEWNSRFRDTVRRFWRGDAGQTGDLRHRLSGSPDLYGEDGRTVYNSVNFVTSHDGFTMNDLVSYDRKHNEANLEDNRDGREDNYSWNCGVEGETADKAVLDLRKRLAKNFMCCLLLSSGTPMILGGDEFLRTQKGNNNAYCQDNGLSWFDWGLAKKNPDILEFTRQLIAMVKRYRVLQMRKYSAACARPGTARFEHRWYGRDLDEPAWNDPAQKILALYLYAEEKGRKAYDIFAIFNADAASQYVRLPKLRGKRRWHRKIDTSLRPGEEIAARQEEIVIDPPGFYIVNPSSVVLLIGL